VTFSDERAALTTLCPKCGDEEALQTSKAREKAVLPSHHKGGLTYVSPNQQRELLQQASSRAPREETNQQQAQPNPNKQFKPYQHPLQGAPKKKYVFSHFEWFLDTEPPYLRRTRAVLKEVKPK
jgi:hypothetical protein